jgi:hypothetical protein
MRLVLVSADFDFALRPHFHPFSRSGSRPDPVWFACLWTMVLKPSRAADAQSQSYERRNGSHGLEKDSYYCLVPSTTDSTFWEARFLLTK